MWAGGYKAPMMPLAPLLSDTTLSCQPWSSGWALYVQYTVGFGRPMTLHSNTTSSSSIASTFCGLWPLRHIGGAVTDTAYKSLMEIGHLLWVVTHDPWPMATPITSFYPTHGDHPVHIICSKCPLSAETHARWSHLIWHNFITVGDKWIKIVL